MRHLLLCLYHPSSFKLNSQNQTLKFFETLALTLSFFPFKSNSQNQPLFSLSYSNFLPSTIAFSILLSLHCSFPTYSVSSHSHCRASLVQPDWPLYPLNITFSLFSSIIVSLENPPHFLTHQFRHSMMQMGSFPFYLFLFSTFPHLRFSSSYIFATTDGFLTYHNLVWKVDR